jgi:hypothetical protein
MRFALHGLPMVLAPLVCACVTDLRVGVREQADAGATDDSGPGKPDGSEPEECLPSECSEPPLERCEDSELTCERNADGLCEWHSEPCPSSDGGLPPCTEQDCSIVLLRPDADAIACSDGSSPTCTRDGDGLCSYVCEKQFSCGTAAGAGCGAGKFCAFDIGKCAGESGGVCTNIPVNCGPEDAPVCGCDGNTYGNPCEAQAKGVNVAFAGSCSTAPVECAECTGPVPNMPTECAGDASHKTGPVCVQGPSGACGWQWLACPSQGSCGDLIADLEPGRCRTEQDCKPGQTCEGASVCACGAQCFAPDTPGYCK